MISDIAIIILSIIGLWITIYIRYARSKNGKVFCPINTESCNTVLDSKWGSIFGIRNEIIGMVYYFALIIAIVLVNSGYYSLNYLLKVASTISTLFSIFLIMVQIRIIKAFCFYCAITAIINITIFILINN